jgi:glycosyltransferase involved in cell wall biosynthesis
MSRLQAASPARATDVTTATAAPAAAVERESGARRPLKVGMVVYSDFHVDSRVQRQALALAERGDEVDCLCLSESASLPHGRGAVHLHEVPVRKLRGSARAYAGGQARFFTRALRGMSSLDRERHFDLVEVHNMPDFLTFCALRPRLRGAPLVLNVHDTFPELFATLFGLSERHPLVRAVRLEERAGAALANALVFATDEARELLRSRGVTPSRSEVVMNTPDERVFGAPRPARTPPAEGPLRAVYHGGLARRFGVELLIAAVGQLEGEVPELTLDVYGPDPDAARALADHAARAAPGRVKVAPEPTPVPLIPGLLERADLGVVPTLRDSFTSLLLPVKLLEYVHMGLPVVAPRLPVIERYFSDSELRFFKPGSVIELAQAILDVRRGPEEAAERAHRASSRLAELGWPRQRDAYLALIDELAGIPA